MSNHWAPLTVYNRSPSEYEALHGLRILKLPNSKSLRQVNKDDSVDPSIDEEYLLDQYKIYANFRKNREEEGHHKSLALQVLMWNEVKVNT